MLFYQIKDVVREHFGRMGVPSSLLNIALAEARRTVEKEGNFWWMKSEDSFSLVIDQQAYEIQTDTIDGGLGLSNFKDARALHWKRSTDVRYEPVSLGALTKDELDLMYDTDDAGPPEAAVIENETLYVYPPLPDATYDMKLFNYQWTENPANTEEDDLTKFFGVTLVYGGIIWGYEIELKDLQGAEYWRNLLGGKPFGRAGEIARIRRENLKRDWKDQISMVPRMGPGRMTRWRLNNLQIYGRGF